MKKGPKADSKSVTLVDSKGRTLNMDNLSPKQAASLLLNVIGPELTQSVHVTNDYESSIGDIAEKLGVDRSQTAVIDLRSPPKKAYNEIFDKVISLVEINEPSQREKAFSEICAQYEAQTQSKRFDIAFMQRMIEYAKSLERFQGMTSNDDRPKAIRALNLTLRDNLSSVMLTTFWEDGFVRIIKLLGMELSYQCALTIKEHDKKEVNHNALLMLNMLQFVHAFLQKTFKGRANLHDFEETSGIKESYNPINQDNILTYVNYLLCGYLNAAYFLGQFKTSLEDTPYESRSTLNGYILTWYKVFQENTAFLAECSKEDEGQIKRWLNSFQKIMAHLSNKDRVLSLDWTNPDFVFATHTQAKSSQLTEKTTKKTSKKEAGVDDLAEVFASFGIKDTPPQSKKKNKKKKKKKPAAELKVAVETETEESKVQLEPLVSQTDIIRQSEREKALLAELEEAKRTIESLTQSKASHEENAGQYRLKIKELEKANIQAQQALGQWVIDYQALTLASQQHQQRVEHLEAQLSVKSNNIRALTQEYQQYRHEVGETKEWLEYELEQEKERYKKTQSAKDKEISQYRLEARTLRQRLNQQAAQHERDRKLDDRLIQEQNAKLKKKTLEIIRLKTDNQRLQDELNKIKSQTGIVLPIHQNLKQLLKELEGHNHLAFVYGGFVRDYLLGQQPHDVDIYTTRKPSEILKHFKQFSQNKYEPNRFHDPVNGLDLTCIEDESLEAFAKKGFISINTLACDCLGRVLDPNGVLTDIELPYLKVLSNSREQFTQDISRVYRLIRMSVQTNKVIMIDDMRSIEHFAIKACALPYQLYCKQINDLFLRGLAYPCFELMNSHQVTAALFNNIAKDWLIQLNGRPAIANYIKGCLKNLDAMSYEERQSYGPYHILAIFLLLPSMVALTSDGKMNQHAASQMAIDYFLKVTNWDDANTKLSFRVKMTSLIIEKMQQYFTWINVGVVEQHQPQPPLGDGAILYAYQGQQNTQVEQPPLQVSNTPQHTINKTL